MTTTTAPYSDDANRLLGAYIAFAAFIRQFAEHPNHGHLDGDQLREALRAELTRLDEAVAS